MTFPALTGSQKQIDWARSIRAEAAETIEAQRAKVGLVYNEKQQAALDKLFSIADAAFWIDNRGESAFGWTVLATKALKS